jgi:hypothetical protein
VGDPAGSVVSELRLRGIACGQAAQVYLPEFIADFNRRFGRFLLTSLAGGIAAPVAAEVQQAWRPAKVGILTPQHSGRHLPAIACFGRIGGASWSNGRPRQIDSPNRSDCHDGVRISM